jgi:threonine aldolase
VLAAAGLWALDHHVERLADDHALAKELAAVLDGLDGLACPPEEIETNIVYARVSHARHDPVSLMNALKESGVLVLPMNATTLRFVTHLDVGREDVERVRRALSAILG